MNKKCNSPRILVVDDSEVMLEVVQQMLISSSFNNIETTNSIQTAVELLQINNSNQQFRRFDIILLDIHLYDASGIELCKMLKSNHLYKDAMIIMITADHNIEQLEKSFVAGAMDFIQKPIKKIELISRLNSAINTLQREEYLKQLAHHDALTGLTNRLLLMDRVEQCHKRTYRDKSKYAIAFIDINNFKQVNDNLGHQAGDEALKIVAKVMSDSVRKVDTVARLAGDEFVLLLEHVENTKQLEKLAKRIRAQLLEPMLLDNQVWTLSISIGFAMFPEDGSTISDLFKIADQNMYLNKNSIITSDVDDSYY